MDNQELKFLIALNHFQKFGPVKLKKLEKYFNNFENAFKSPVSLLIKAGIEESVANEFSSARISINPERLMDDLQKEGIKIITLKDEKYPSLLAKIYNSPFLLYYKGELPKGDIKNIGVVGTRKPTVYGRQVTERLIRDLSSTSARIISGLALGIDSIAHQSALENKLTTYAVLGSGIDRQSIYPSSNRYLSDKIVAEGGTIISELPIGTPPLKHHFPLRNRIIAGLSAGTVVIEAALKSGALITAYQALDNGRELFAVPGPILSPESEGPNSLLKKGAVPITSAQDILDCLDIKDSAIFTRSEPPVPETPEEAALIAILDHEPKHVDELVRASKLDTSKINSTLIVMEMKGTVKNVGNMKYVAI